MGGGASRPASEIINEMVTEVTANVINSQVQICTYTVDQQQLIEINGSGNKIVGNEMKQVMMIDLQCTMKSVNQTELVDDITAQLTQKITDKYGGALGLGSGGHGDVGDLHNTVQAAVTKSVTNENIQRCLNAINNRQAISVTGNNNTVMYNKQDQASNILIGCISDVTTKNILNTKIAQSLDQTVDKESSGFNFTTQIQQVMMWVLGIIVAIVVLVITIKVAMMVPSGSRYGRRSQDTEYRSDFSTIRDNPAYMAWLSNLFKSKPKSKIEMKSSDSSKLISKSEIGSTTLPILKSNEFNIEPEISELNELSLVLEEDTKLHQEEMMKQEERKRHQEEIMKQEETRQYEEERKRQEEIRQHAEERKRQEEEKNQEEIKRLEAEITQYENERIKAIGMNENKNKIKNKN